MPEILIRNISPDIPWSVSGSPIRAIVLADLPDKSGSYKIGGIKLDLNLVDIKYRSPREVERQGYRSVLIGDPGDWATPEDWETRSYTYLQTIGVRSWPCAIDSELIASREGNTSRIIPINRRGVGVQTIAPNTELVVRLRKPIIDQVRDANGKWIQIHNYPDYPEKSGTLDRVKKYWVVEKPAEPKLEKPKWTPDPYSGPSRWNPGAVI